MASPPSSRLTTLPVLRAFRSSRFRTIVAFGLVVTGVALYVVYYQATRGGYPPWLFDFEAYLQAANRIVTTGTPYTSAMLAAPVDAVCDGCYLYPPVLAQALVPLTVLPPTVANIAWFAITEAMAIGSVWLATGIGGASRSWERFLWSTVAALSFTPVFHSNYYGNMGSVLALLVTLVAMGGAAAGVASALGLVLKLSPGGLVPATLAQGRGSRRAFVVTFVVALPVSFLLSPQAWLDYATVLPNMLAGSTAYPFNLAPANAALDAGLPSTVVSAVRLASILAGVALIVLSMWLARKPSGMPAAALAGTVAMLLIPSTLWAHYLVVLLPFAAMAWPGANAGSRLVLLAGATIVSLTAQGLSDGLPHVGVALMVVGAGWVLWPRSTGANHG